MGSPHPETLMTLPLTRPDTIRSRLINPRVLRLGVASALVLAVGAILAPRVTSYVSTSAVVNAPTISLKSPFQGRVIRAPAMATVIRSGDLIASIEPSIEQRKRLGELVAERDANASLLAALRTQIAQLEAQASTETDLKAQNDALSLRKQGARIDEARAEIAQAEARSREVDARAARSAKLAERGQIATAAVVTDREDLAVALHDVTRLTARLHGLQIDQEGLLAGLSIDGDDEHGARLSQIDLRLEDLVTEAARIAAAEIALDTRISALETERFDPVSSGNAVVQSAKARAGDEVGSGEEFLRLVDCDRRFLEVAVSERHFESITPGSPATVWLRGSADTFEATVTAVRGAGAKLDYPELAAEPPQVPEGQLRVIVALDPADLTGAEGVAAAGNFCDVGRTAEVRFNRSLIGDLRLFGFAFGQKTSTTRLASTEAAPGENQ